MKPFVYLFMIAFVLIVLKAFYWEELIAYWNKESIEVIKPTTTSESTSPQNLPSSSDQGNTTKKETPIERVGNKIAEKIKL
ncbi:MAG: hypothetical protein PHW18_10890 [Sulfuricurvum sp.]|uniref:hypothetical protein n=1 Tax=Sulfuricurvum sp. TaxID=2025608 RepID=UPI0026024879|nr:hypothetical protein [Sulfuricurvum sp.]MDD2830069.1 hypothetical protein [Sulfuricurvum sp.]MDD4948184.1 hypothetical protein [Sulfuricurvum sp.]